VQRIHPHDVAELAGRVALAAFVLCRFQRRVCEFLGGGVFGIWNPGFNGWVVGATCDDDDTGVASEMWAQKVEEECVTDVVYGEGLFDAIDAVGDTAGELEAGIHDKGGDWREGVGGVRGCEFADFGEGGEVEGEIGDIGLVEGFIDGAGGIVIVGP